MDGPEQVRTLTIHLPTNFKVKWVGRRQENLHTQVESVYSRAMGISGARLTNNYHFGQSVLNDYGRPIGKALTASLAHRPGRRQPVCIYARGEYESLPLLLALGAALVSSVRLTACLQILLRCPWPQ